MLDRNTGIGTCVMRSTLLYKQLLSVLLKLCGFRSLGFSERPIPHSSKTDGVIVPLTTIALANSKATQCSEISKASMAAHFWSTNWICIALQLATRSHSTRNAAETNVASAPHGLMNPCIFILRERWHKRLKVVVGASWCSCYRAGRLAVPTYPAFNLQVSSRRIVISVNPVLF